MARIFVYKTMGENESLPPPKIDPNYKIEYFFSTTKIAREVTKNTNIQVIFFDFEKEQFSASKIEKLLQILSPLQHIFKIILHPTMAINNPQLRWKYFQYGVNMISADRQQVDNIISTIIQLTTAQNEAILLQNNANNSNNLSNNSNSANNITLTYTCPYCQLSNLPEEPLYTHVEIYHANSPNENFECVVCKLKQMKNVQLNNVEKELIQLSRKSNLQCICTVVMDLVSAILTYRSLLEIKK